MTTQDIPPLWELVDDGHRTLCDLTGAELDLNAAEAICKKRNFAVHFQRPSNAERARQEANDLLSGGIPLDLVPLSNYPDAKVDLILQQPKGFDLEAREPALKEAVKVLREMLDKHDLLPPDPPQPGQLDELKDALPKPHADLGR